MSQDRLLPVLVSVAVIVLVAVVQERSRYLAAILAAMPLTAPLALWIVYSATKGNHAETAAFAGSMLVGFLASVVFMVACWLGLRQAWSLPAVLGVAGLAWLVAIALATWLGRWRV
jgi:uncharacterized membrane protein (GlpM family)